MKKTLVTNYDWMDLILPLLLEKGYEVHGIVRRASTFNTDRLDHLYKDPLVDVQFISSHGDLLYVQLVKLL